MAELARAVASLRITGEDPSPCGRFGVAGPLADEAAPADLDAQVTAILGRLTPDESVWAAVCATYNVELSCGWFMEHGNEGVSIGPETMLALAARGILLDIDLYGGDSDKAPDQVATAARAITRRSADPRTHRGM